MNSKILKMIAKRLDIRQSNCLRNWRHSRRASCWTAINQV